MSKTQFVLMLAILLAGQFIGFRYMATLLPIDTPAEITLKEIHDIQADINAALAELRSRQDDINFSAQTADAVPDAEQLREMLRATLEQELSTYLGAVPEPQPQTVVETNVPPNEQAIFETDSVVQRALASGRWTIGDTEALLPFLHELSEQERARLSETVHKALRENVLLLENGLPPPL